MNARSFGGVVTLVALCAGASSAGAGQSAADAQDRAARPDSQLVREIQRQVLSYPQYSIFDLIQVEVNDGLVALSGKVTMPYKRDDIEKRVASIRGIRELHNRIDVLPVSQFDDELRFRIARAIYGNAAFRQYASMANPPIHIIVEHGRVTLEGTVNSHVDRMLARSIASSFDAFEVRNELRTPAD
jgi:hyperosmotically inducible protein